MRKPIFCLPPLCFFSNCSAIFAALVIVSSAALAQDDEPSADDEIVVSAMRTPRPISETGSSIFKVDAETIARRQYSFAADALRDAPGVSIARNSSFGGVASARIRGAASGQTLVVIDGIVINDPSAPQGGFNFANLDVVDIESIEVLRGPQSLLYGADAIGGVISIKTKTATAPGAALFIEGGSLGLVRGGATLSHGDDRKNARLSVSGIRSDGISRAATGQEKDGYNSVAGSFSGGINLGGGWASSLLTRYSESQTELDGFPPPNFTLADSDDTEETDEFAIAGRISHARANSASMHAVTIAFNDIDRANFSGGTELFSASGKRLSADYLGTVELNPSLTLSGGGELERTHADVSGIDERTSNAAIFAVLEVKPAHGLTISGGARRDEFSNFEGATTGRVTAAYALPQTVLRASWGQGFRAPSIFELNFSLFGVAPNRDLRPERATGFDFGIEHRLTSNTVIKTAFFHTKTSDLIDFDFAGGGFFNIAESRSRGVEAEIETAINAFVDISANYTFVDAIDKATGQQRLRQPKHRGVIIIGANPLDRLRLSASVIFNGRENDFPAANKGFIRADIRGAFALSDSLEIYTRVENAAGTIYQDVSGFGEPGVTAFGGIRVRI